MRTPKSHIVPILVGAAALLIPPLIWPAMPFLPFVLAASLVLAAGLLAQRWRRGAAYRARHLSPEKIVSYKPARTEPQSVEELSQSIVERAQEIRRSLQEESPSEIRIEMCALGYRTCANDMITLTHLVNEELRDAGALKRVRLRRARKRATDVLSAARESLPPGALRATRQEHQ